MAKATIPSADDPAETIEINLKEPWIGGLLAWLVPGLGHLYQGRTAKGLLFFVCVLGTFLYGFSLGKGKVVYASTPGQPFRWQYYCQLGVGLPAMPALLQRHRVKNRQEPLWKSESFPHGFMAPPGNRPVDSIDHSGRPSRQPNESAKWIAESYPAPELGKTYTVVAGLLNILVICDAVAGPLILMPKTSNDPKEPSEGSE